MVTNNSVNAHTTNGTVVTGNGTGYTNVSYTASANNSTIVSRDVNGNSAFVNVIASVTSTVTAGQTIALNAGSTGYQVATGTSTITYNLPDATTMYAGQTYYINNNSTLNASVFLNDGTTPFATMVPGSFMVVYNTNNATTNGVWDNHWTIPASGQYGTAGISVTGYTQASTTQITGYATTATAGSTTTLTATSAQQQYFTGTLTQTVVLPVTSTLVLGQSYTIVNNSTGAVTVQSSGANTIQVMAANTSLIVTCILTSGTTAASWNAQYNIETALTLPLSLANGGTNSSLTASNGGIFYSSASAGAILSGTATANQVLLSGSSTTPSWSTATYPATAGNSGNVLTSNGTNWTSSAPVTSTPNSNVIMSDDFIGWVNSGTISAGSAAIFSVFVWDEGGGSTMSPPTTPDSAHPGKMVNPSVSSGACGISLTTNAVDSSPNSAYTVLPGGGQIVLNWVFNIATLSTGTNTYTLNLGFGDPMGKNINVDQNNGCYFKYSNGVNSGNWVIACANASTRTTTNSSTAVTTGWHNAQVTINAAGTSAVFVMDGVNLGTINSNLPTTNGTCPMISFDRSAGTISADSIEIDLFYMTQTLTTTR